MSRPTVFIVDDHADVLRATAMLLGAYGWDTREFGNAHDCVAAALDRPPACILSDLRMPGMDGNALMQALRRAGLKTPVVVMTASPPNSPAVLQAAAHASAVVAKPCDGAELDRALHWAVGIPLSEPIH